MAQSNDFFKDVIIYISEVENMWNHPFLISISVFKKANREEIFL